MQHSTRVGAFVLAFLGLLAGSYFVLGKSLWAEKLDTYYVEFPDAGGVSVGTAVQLAGVRVGKVSDVKLVSPTLAKVTLHLQDGVSLPAGTQAVLPASLIGIGDNPMQLVVASNEPGSLNPGDTIKGRKGSPLEGILPDTSGTLKEVNATLAATRKLLEDQKLKTSVTDLLVQSTATMNRFAALADRADKVMASNQDEIALAIQSGAKAMADVQKVTAAVAKLVESGKLEKDSTALMVQLKETAKKADDLVGAMTRLVADPALIGSARSAAESAAKIASTGEKIATNTEAITRNGITISEKAVTLTDKANEIATNAAELTAQLKSVLTKVEGFLDRTGKPSGIGKLESSIDLTHESKPGHWRTDLSFSYPLSDGAFHFGLYDAFESNKLTAQFGKTVNSKMDYRYGVYASKPGVGVDYKLAPRLGLRGDLWDINDPRLDLRARYVLGNGLVGWVGIDRVFQRNAPTIGLGVRR
ncbi:MAG: MlaD family protein [Fimbriimonas sp.]